MTDSADSDSQAVDSPWQRESLFWLLTLIVLAMSIGGGLAYGPETLRRPVLTPALVGVVLGIAGGWLARSAPVPVRRSSYWVIGLAAIASTGLMHREIFRQIERAARDRESNRSPIVWKEQILDELDAPESSRREFRLMEQPRFEDYLAHRAAFLVGEIPPPLPLLLLMGELLLAAAVGVLGFHCIVREG